jgi:hypothetical protein
VLGWRHPISARPIHRRRDPERDQHCLKHPSRHRRLVGPKDGLSHSSPGRKPGKPSPPRWTSTGSRGPLTRLTVGDLDDFVNRWGGVAGGGVQRRTRSAVAHARGDDRAELAYRVVVGNSGRRGGRAVASLCGSPRMIGVSTRRATDSSLLIQPVLHDGHTCLTVVRKPGTEGPNTRGERLRGREDGRRARAAELAE